jgi:hypothetical protein
MVAGGHACKAEQAGLQGHECAEVSERVLGVAFFQLKE